MSESIEDTNEKLDGLPVLSVRAEEAAKMLSISKRTLWTLTNQRLIPHKRIGRVVVYPVDALRAWANQVD